MKLEAAHKATEIGVEFPRALDTKFALLEKLIKIFSEAKKANELDKWIAKVKQEFLIDEVGCSKDVAESYIKAALNRI